MIKYLTKKCKQKRGFTLMEVMVVVAILAVIVMIAVPSVISMRKNMQFTQRNDYAKSIFMAAQSNLTQMRSTGQLERLTELAEKETPKKTAASGAPSGYYYTLPTGNANALGDTYNLVLPVNSIDSTIRDEQVIIEYNPKAGIVYSVFYYEGSDGDLLGMYESGKISRTDEEERKKVLVGYYSVGSVDALEAQELNVRQVSSTLSYTNAQEGIVTVTVPILDKKANNIFSNTDAPADDSGEVTPNVATNDYSRLISGLEVTLIVTGETGGTSFLTTFKQSDINGIATFNPTSNFQPFAIDVNIPLDSLSANGSFAEIAANKNEADSGLAIAPGNNVTITAEVTYVPSASDPIIMIESATLAGINPMYHSLTHDPNAADGAESYILAVSNGRHLQNLEQLDATLAEKITSIVFVNQTEEDLVTTTKPNTDDSNKSEGSEPSESSESGIQTASETPSTPSTPSGETDDTEAESTELTLDWNATVAYYYDQKNTTLSSFSPIDNAALSKVSKIIGNGVKISNLSINVTTGNAGLFATLNGTSIEGITLVDPVVESTATVSGSGTGALIGTATDVDISNCQVTGPLEEKAPEGETAENATETKVTPVGITGSVSVGGLVGNAESGTTLTDCSSAILVRSNSADQYSMGGLVGSADEAKFNTCNTEAVVLGSDSVLANLGGLVGYAKASGFSNCGTDCSDTTTNGAEIQSGAQTHFNEVNGKNNLGGLVGYALGKTTFTNCSSSKDTTVLSNTNANSNLGGLVGYADDVTFTTCSSNASVNGSVKVDKDGNATTDIPNNNLGGFVGYSANTKYDDIDVTLNYLPAYAQDAGIFAGYISSSEMKDLALALTVSDHDSATHTVQYFGAVSGRVESSSLTKAEIKTNGNINNANHAAGVFYITQGTSIDNVSVEVESGNIYGNRSAGFVGENGAGSNIQNSSVLGNFTYTSDYKVGDLPASYGVAGFVYDNSGSINTSFANVSLPGGSAFVAANNGTIKDCYGWTWKSTPNASNTLEITQKCSYSYFVNGDTDDMVLYEGLGSDAVSSTVSTDIRDTYALTDPWALEILNEGTATNATPAWSNDGKGDGYPYPELSIGHVGKSADPDVSDYPYYLYYVETYSEGEGYVLMEYAADGSINKGGVSSSELSTPPVEADIHYYLYHRTDDALKSHGTALSRTEYEEMYEDISRFYTIYELNKDKIFEIDGITFNTCYPLYNESGHYRIRTAQQFANISKNTGGTFYIEQSISPSDTLSSFSGTMTAANDVTIKAENSLVDKLSGTLSGLTVTGLTEPMVGTMSGGKIENCNATAQITSGDKIGVLAGTVDGGSITGVSSASGSVSGSNYVGGAVGYVKDGTVSDVTSSAAVSGTGENVGMFVGYAESGEFTNCKSTANTYALPFGHFATKKLTNATHKSTTSVSEKVLLSNFGSFTDLDGIVPETVDVTLTNCHFNSNQPALLQSEDYYYTVDTSDYLLETGTSHTMNIIKVDDKELTFSAIRDLCNKVDPGIPVATSYYVIINSAYYRVYASVTSQDVPVEATDGSDSSTITQYSFDLTANSSSVYTKVVTEKELGNKLPDDANAPTLYQVGLYDTDTYKLSGGNYLIYGGTSHGYLTYNSKEGIQWGGSNSTKYSLWIGDGQGGWKNFVEPNAVITITPVDLQKDGFTGLVTVTFENTEVAPYDCTGISTHYVALYYKCTALGNTYEVNFPTTSSESNES